MKENERFVVEKIGPFTFHVPRKESAPAQRGIPWTTVYFCGKRKKSTRPLELREEENVAYVFRRVNEFTGREYMFPTPDGWVSCDRESAHVRRKRGKADSWPPR